MIDVRTETTYRIIADHEDRIKELIAGQVRCDDAIVTLCDNIATLVKLIRSEITENEKLAEKLRVLEASIATSSVVTLTEVTGNDTGALDAVRGARGNR